MNTTAYLERNWRYLMLATILVIVIGAGVFIVATLPPRTIVMVTGPKGGANYELGDRYREILARSGVIVQLRPTTGSQENLELLRDPTSGVSAGLIQGGVANRADFPGVESLGVVGYEPLWLFYRSEIGANLQALAGRRLSIGPQGSGSRALALEILKKTKINAIVGEVSEFSPEVAAEKLIAGDIDAAFIVTSWDSPVVQTLLNAKGVEPASFARADAFVALYPFLNKLTLPAGVVDLIANRPPADVVLLAPKASLAVRADLHSAIQFLLLTAAVKIHSQPGIFQKASQFPAAESIDFPLSDEAQRFYKSGRPFLQEHLPFWLATLVERGIVVIVPLVAVIYPLLKLIPSMYQYIMQSRIQRLYAEMRKLDRAMDDPAPKLDAIEVRSKIDELEERASRLSLPPAYGSSLYTLRSHIGLVRNRFALNQTKDAPQPKDK
jgi:TRAP-type uncharacterized transport system substrate-binding protein